MKSFKNKTFGESEKKRSRRLSLIKFTNRIDSKITELFNNNSVLIDIIISYIKNKYFSLEDPYGYYNYIEACINRYVFTECSSYCYYCYLYYGRMQIINKKILKYKDNIIQIIKRVLKQKAIW